MVHGLKRRSSSFNTERVDHLYQDPHRGEPRLLLHYGDMTNSTNLIRLLQQIVPDEVYNLAAQSHVQVSFETPEYTANADALGPLRLLEAIRILGLEKTTKFYQASTSELYGLVREVPQRETTPFYPRSPYGVAKLYAYWITVNYREAYNIFASNGVLFNHESPIRGETFVTRKITRAVAAIHLGLAKRTVSGQPGFAGATGAMLATMSKACGGSCSIPSRTISCWPPGRSTRCASSWSAPSPKSAGGLSGAAPAWTKSASMLASGAVLVRVDPRYFRPTEVQTLLGDASKAREKLGWRPTVTFNELVAEMVASDLARLASPDHARRAAAD